MEHKEKINSAKEAIETLNEVEASLRTAYNQLIDSGIGEKYAKQICMVFVKAAFEKKEE